LEEIELFHPSISLLFLFWQHADACYPVVPAKWFARVMTADCDHHEPQPCMDWWARSQRNISEEITHLFRMNEIEVCILMI
jgi:hypothetical protein